MDNTEKFNLSEVYYTERGEKNLFKISWKMTDWCPYHCSYCYMSNAVAAAKAKKDNPTQEMVEEIASKFDRYVETHADPDADVVLHLIGGEVSVFNLIGILDKIKRLKKISLATNFYREQSYWEELKAYCGSRKIGFGISSSFHLEMLNEKQRWNFCEKLKAINGQMKAVVRNENIEVYRPYFDFVMENNLGLEITFERDGNNRGTTLSPENQKYIDTIRDYQFERREKKGFKPHYIAHLKDGRVFNYSSNIALLNNTNDGILDYSGFYCNAGENNVRINQKGQLLRSACRICSTYMKIGNILDESSWIPREKLKPFICDCNFEDLKGQKKLKGCTCFNNTEMWLPGFDRKTGEYTPKEVEIPDYHKIFEGTTGQMAELNKGE